MVKSKRRVKRRIISLMQPALPMFGNLQTVNEEAFIEKDEPVAKRNRRVKHRPKPLIQPAILLFGDLQSIKIEELVRKIELDDALIQPPWRLEYVYLDKGFAHYRLLHDERLIGIRDVTSRRRLMAIRRGLAAYLAQCGARPELALIIKGGARVELKESKHRLDPLFMFVGEQRKGRRATDEVRVYTLSAR